MRRLFVAGVCLYGVCTASIAAGQQAAEPVDSPPADGRQSASHQPAANDSPSASATTFSLDQLTDRAANNSDLVDEFEAKRAKAEWDSFRADYAWVPDIKSTTIASVVPDNADPDELNENFDEYGSLDIGPYIREDLDVIVPVYTFGRVDIAEQLAAVGVDNADLELANARLDVIYKTKRAYWGLRLSRSFGTMLDEGDQRIGDQLDKMQEARDFGEAEFDTADFRKLQMFSAEVDERILDNKKLDSLARAGLHFLTDLPPETTVGVPPLGKLGDPPTLKSRQYYVHVAMKHRPEAVQLDKAVRARHLQSELAQAEWYPNVFAALRVGVGWSTKRTAFQRICPASSREAATTCDFPQDQASVGGQNLFAEPYGDPLHSFSVQIGVGLRWNIDPIEQTANDQKKEAQYMAMLAQRRRAQGAIKLDVRKLYQDAADGLQKISINKRRMTAARRWRDQMGLSAQTAGADLKEAVKPLKAYYEARAKYLQAIYDYLVARGALAKGIGARQLDQTGGAFE